MFHVKVGRKSMKMEGGTATLLFKKFRYHVMHNQKSYIGWLKIGFLIEIRLGIF